MVETSKMAQLRKRAEVVLQRIDKRCLFQVANTQKFSSVWLMEAGCFLFVHQDGVALSRFHVLAVLCKCIGQMGAPAAEYGLIPIGWVWPWKKEV